METLTTTCCIVGGGLAGVFLGYLLARSGVDVIVLEKHADFLRDFRGDKVHPSTFALLDELGLLDEMLAITDFRADELKVNINGRSYVGPTLKHLKTKCPFIGFIPQWDFLNLISRRARQFPCFDLRMSTKGTDLLREKDRVTGVRWLLPSLAPLLRRLAGYWIGIGFQPEHIATSRYRSQGAADASN
tara:strand:+ start:60 stop:623 length:564 start_codon:yes stop_codon:yes gene_type:complete